MRIVKALFGAAIAAVPMAAYAQPVDGLYISLGAGLNIMQNESITAIGHTSLNNVNLNTNLGAVTVPALHGIPSPVPHEPGPSAASGIGAGRSRSSPGRRAVRRRGPEAEP